jgi:Na+-driven multidrug efflux pump
MQDLTTGSVNRHLLKTNFVASGVVFVASSMFQALGNTVPSLVSSFLRVVGVAFPAFFLASLPGFQLRWIWYLSVASVALQMMLSLWLLRREMSLRLNAEPVPIAAPSLASAPES